VAPGAVVYLTADAVVIEVTSTVTVEMAVIVVEATIIIAIKVAFASPIARDVASAVVAGGHPISARIRRRGHNDRRRNRYAESNANSKTNAGEH
jgi:hypothetical protein